MAYEQDEFSRAESSAVSRPHVGLKKCFRAPPFLQFASPLAPVSGLWQRHRGMLRCLLLLCLAASSNPKPPGVAAPKPPPEVQQLRFFEGEWRCTGKVLDITVQTRWAFKPEANHFWLGVRNAEQKSKSHPLTREAQGYWGYDAVGRQFVRVMMFSQGDWEQATSPGWTGEEWLWTGELNQADGHKLPLRHSITSRGSREFTDKLELNVDGEWRVAATSTVCKK